MKGVICFKLEPDDNYFTCWRTLDSIASSLINTNNYKVIPDGPPDNRMIKIIW
jgi:hypothetical protein